MAGLDPYLDKYEHEHHNAANRVLHAIGIPCIFAGLILFFFAWRWGLVFFAGGWVMLLVGHRIEGNNPAFFQGPVYFLMGPIWVAREILEWMGVKRTPRAESKAQG